MIRFITAVSFVCVLVSCAFDSNKKSEETALELQPLQSPVDTASAEPYLFTDKNGAVYLSWITKDTQKSTLNYSMLKGEKWSEPSQIAAGENWFVNWADYPLIASDGNNNLISHFLEKSEKGTYTYDIKLTTSSNAGKTWSDPVILHDDGKKAEHGFVSMVPYGENYFVSWLDGRNAASEGGGGHGGGHQGQMTVRGAVVDRSGKKVKEWELDGRACDCCQTSAAITDNGPVVIYRDRSEDETRDISIVRLVNQAWTSPKPIFSDNWKIAGCPVNGPRIDAQGNHLAVAWFTSANNQGRVNVVFSTDGGANFSTPIRIDEGKGIGRVDVILLDEKSAMVSWMEGSVIKARKVYRDGKKELPLTVATSSESRSSGFPQMTKSGDNVIFAWSDNSEKTIKLARLSL